MYVCIYSFELRVAYVISQHELSGERRMRDERIFIHHKSNWMRVDEGRIQFGSNLGRALVIPARSIDCMIK